MEQSPQGHELIGPYIPRNAARPQATIFPSAMNTVICVDGCQRDLIKYQQTSMMKANIGWTLVQVFHTRKIGQNPCNKRQHLRQNK
ncbi:MAG: hypothetical protein EZS28_026414 [Streblomastix strix]|uniref:Uncharacterized protein n=1 Tax=Streblomastix strix TaxID=222440 RepID=A0A5J4V6K3_9EUKA|nr:MAG: hypothetical protein EZS28_026414 [Streblomastix strix]